MSLFSELVFQTAGVLLGVGLLVVLAFGLADR